MMFLLEQSKPDTLAQIMGGGYDVIMFKAATTLTTATLLFRAITADILGTLAELRRRKEEAARRRQRKQ